MIFYYINTIPRGAKVPYFAKVPLVIWHSLIEKKYRTLLKYVKTKKRRVSLKIRYSEACMRGLLPLHLLLRRLHVRR